MVSHPRPSEQSRSYLVLIAFAAIAVAGLVSFLHLPESHAGSPAALAAPAPAAAAIPLPAQAAPSASAQRGRYIILTAGCNDCHTPGWMQVAPDVPEEQWLTGVPIGWRGPWGTTYASNLRLFVKDFDEELFVKTVRARNTRPPMPWASLHAMTDEDLRAVYRYVKSLPQTGEHMPQFCPPGVEPPTPYLSLEPKLPQQAKGNAPSPAANTATR